MLLFPSQRRIYRYQNPLWTSLLIQIKIEIVVVATLSTTVYPFIIKSSKKIGGLASNISDAEPQPSLNGPWFKRTV